MATLGQNPFGRPSIVILKLFCINTGRALAKTMIASAQVAGQRERCH